MEKILLILFIQSRKKGNSYIVNLIWSFHAERLNPITDNIESISDFSGLISGPISMVDQRWKSYS